MRHLFKLIVHALATIARLLGPGGIRSVVAESILIQHQMLILNRSHRQAPKLRASDRFVAGFCALFMRPIRLIRSAIVLKPSTLLKLHRALKNRKYHLLFSSKRRGNPGPKGPSKDLIDAIVATKERNLSWGCPRIAQQVSLAFGISIDKDTVRRVLAANYRPVPHSGGPSWLTFIGHLKDSLWSIDLFRCESATLRTHWILVVKDQYTRRIIGIGVHVGTVDRVALCRMFHRAIVGQRALRKYLSSDHDPLFRFAQWQANLRILEIDEIKTIPYVPLSHPFVERLIGAVRPESLDRTLFWTNADLENKLLECQDYYNGHRTHNSLRGRTPDQNTRTSKPLADLTAYRWQSHCRGLYQTPEAADISKTPACHCAGGSSIVPIPETTPHK